VEIVGWLGVAAGFLVAPPQLYKILKHKKTDGISRVTYSFLVLALICYLIHAISIGDMVFITAQSINLFTNTIILGYLIWG